MNQMKYLNLSVFCLLSVFLHAQFDLVIPSGNIEKIEIEADYAELVIESRPVSQIEVISNVNINDGKHNDHLQLTQTQNSRTLELRSVIHNPDEIPRQKIVYDDRGNIIERKDILVRKWNWDKESDNHTGMVRVEQKINVKHTIIVPESMQISVQAKYGEVNYDGKVTQTTLLSSTYGVVEAKPTQLKAPLNIISTYGCVDVTVPQNVSADVRMETTYGHVFTDLSMDFTPSSSGSRILASYNGGGQAINMESPYSNIYLRKL